MDSLFSQWLILFGCLFLISSGNAYSLDRKIDDLLDEGLLNDIDATGVEDGTDYRKEPISKKHAVYWRHNSNKNDLSEEEVEERVEELVNNFQALERLRTNTVKTESVDRRDWWKGWCTRCGGNKTKPNVKRPKKKVVSGRVTTRSNRRHSINRSHAYLYA